MEKRTGGLDETRVLLDRARDGDQEALDRLFERYLPRLQRWARGRLPSWARDMADTHDLVQDTLLRTFKKIDGPSGSGSGSSPEGNAIATTLVRHPSRRCRARPGSPV